MPCRETNLLMLKLYFPPRCRLRWLIPGLLPAGLSLLAGASKAGKSWLCLWLCLQLARGGEIWGRTTQPQTVLYLCLEDTYARIQGRLFRLTEDPVPNRLYFQTGSRAIGDGLELQIEKFLSQHPETGLVVIDTLQKVRTADPDYLWRTADFVRRTGSWTGTATELLTAAGITEVQPNQFTRKLVEHFYTVFAPQGIRYQSRRTANTRLLCFTRDEDDGHDGSDDDPGRCPLPSGTVPAGEEGAAPVPSSSSSPSPGPHHGSEHGLCVADGHPFAAADTAASTGTAPSPDFSRETDS